MLTKEYGEQTRNAFGMTFGRSSVGHCNAKSGESSDKLHYEIKQLTAGVPEVGKGEWDLAQGENEADTRSIYI